MRRHLLSVSLFAAGLALGYCAALPHPRLPTACVVSRLSGPDWLHTAGASHLHYFTTRPRDYSELNALPRIPGELAQWKGVLLVEIVREGVAIDLEEGPGCRFVRGVLLFGDADMVAQAARRLQGFRATA